MGAIRTGVAAIVLAAALSGCASAAAPGPSIPLAATPSATISTIASVSPSSAGSAAALVVIKAAIGPCRETDTTIEPPADNEQLCTYGRMVIGHTLPKKGSTYLSRIVPKLKQGQTIVMGGTPWTVRSVTSIPKSALPREMYARAGIERYLVTCDPASGYRTWADGIAHSNNNLVVTLVPAA